MPIGRGLTQIIGWPFLALIAACALHLYFFQHFPPPGAPLNDERVYTSAAVRYAFDLRSGRPQDVLFDDFNNEHPALGKLLYAAGVLTDWDINGYEPVDPNTFASAHDDNFWAQPANARLLTDARITSAILGALAVYVLARINRLAGMLLAVSTPMLVYSSAAFLEAPGVLFSTAAVYMITRGSRDNAPTAGVLIASAITAGMAIASKFYFGIVLAPILYQLAGFRGSHQFARRAVLFLGVSFLAFGLMDLPFFVSGMAKSLALIGHNGLEYASGWGTQSINWPTHWYTEFTLLAFGFRSWFTDPSPFVLTIDPLIGVCAVLGGMLLLRRRSPIAIWLAAAVLFLGAYPVKYPQYTMLGVVPLCLTAAYGMSAAAPLVWKVAVTRIAWPKRLLAAWTDTLSHGNTGWRLG
jgi:hypothetical protein